MAEGGASQSAGAPNEQWLPSGLFAEQGANWVLEVNGIGTLIDGLQISDVRLNDLHLDSSPFAKVRIGVKPDSQHVGGLNLFGRKFGNYPEDLVLRIAYE